MKGSAYTIGFAAVLGSTCALLLTAAAHFTGPYKEANQRAEELAGIARPANQLARQLQREQEVRRQ